MKSRTTDLRIKSYGLILDPIEIGKDYQFGGYGSLDGEILQSDGQWHAYLPLEERQANFGVDTQACVSFGTLSACEMLLRRIYGEIDNFSDRYLAKVGETTPQGASPQKIAEALRKLGVVREGLWPFTSNLTNWDLFYSDIPQTIRTLAEEFLARFDFKHEYVSTAPATLKQALKYGPLGISVSAWTQNDNGLYYSPFANNHWTVLIGYKEGEYWEVFDSYADFDGKFIKRLAWNHTFSQAKRYRLTIRVDTKSDRWFNYLIALIRKAFGLPSAPVPTTPVPAPVPVPVPTPMPTPRLLIAAKAAVGKDISPKENELGCAESVSYLLKQTTGNFPSILSTATLFITLKNDKRFKATLDLEAGCIIISPTGKGNGQIKHGHVGITGENGAIYSNDSRTFKWAQNFSFDGWKTYYRTKGGYPIYLFKLL